MSAEAKQPGLCHQEWDQVLDDARYPVMEQKIQHWESMAGRCGRSGLYEFRMGHLYTLAGQWDKARKVINAGLSYNTPYEKELLSGLASIALTQRDWDRAEKQYMEIIKKYPDWYDGYQGLGTVRLVQGKPAEAVDYLNQANQREPQAVTYRHLVIAYHQLGEHEQAAQAVNAAYEMDPAIQKDRDVMVAAAVSYAKLGKYKVADGFLMMLLEARPEVREDAEFVNVAAYISKKLQESSQP